MIELLNITCNFFHLNSYTCHLSFADIMSKTVQKAKIHNNHHTRTKIVSWCYNLQHNKLFLKKLLIACSMVAISAKHAFILHIYITAQSNTNKEA